jgi:hypothetical protein
LGGANFSHSRKAAMLQRKWISTFAPGQAASAAAAAAAKNLPRPLEKIIYCARF